MTKRFTDDDAPPAPASEPATKAAKAKKGDMPSLASEIITVLGAKLAKQGVRVDTAENVEYLAAPKVYIDTGIHGLDLMLSREGGLPTGRFIEVFGNEGSGKTAMAEFLIGRFLRLGSPPHYLDYEKSMDADHLACYGVKPGEFLYPDLPTLEDGWDYIAGTLDIIKKRNAKREKEGLGHEPPALFVWDSLAQAAPRAEMDEKNHEDAHMSLVARAMAKGFRKHTRAVNDSEACVLFINQVRDKPGSQGYGPKTDTPGGRAAKFAYSMRLKLAKIETIKNGDTPVGQMIEVQSVKNKLAPYPQKTQIVLSYKRGIDVNWSNFLWFQDAGYIASKGTAGYVWKGQSDTFRRKDFSDFIKANKALVKEARKAIYEEERARFNKAGGSSDDEDAA